MKWLIGIAVVVLVTHLYFRYGVRRLEREHEEQKEGGEPPTRV